MKTLRAKPVCTDDEAKSFAGEFLTESHYDALVTDDADIMTPEGQYLVRYRKKIVPNEIYADCRPALRKAAQWSGNRGCASGDTKRTKHQTTKDLVRSGIIGSFDRQGGRNPYCRLTAYNRNHPELFDSIRPLVKVVDDQFRHLMPKNYEAQKSYARRTDAAWTIDDSAFTTITVNKNWRTACHQDAGDLKQGFGMICGCSTDNYQGAYTVLPQYRVAFDLRLGDVVAFNVHEWHGNTPFKRIPGTGPMERISCVFYYREKMFKCGTMEHELDRAKNLYGQIYDET